MSRVANKPIVIPKGVEVKLQDQDLSVKGAKGNLSRRIPDMIEIQVEGGVIRVRPRTSAKQADAIAGTIRALINNMVTGVSQGFEKKLLLEGVGYRAQAQGNQLNLALGFSHPIVYHVPAGITIETPSQAELVVRGADKHQVGQVAAEIRAFRSPEPYKGKGIRYADERVIRKEAKKK
ncbi:MAG: 50S ribosomal protein L6 [Methylohalobius sp.]|nr:50S ribosomal protein L6 [Methylohalobius sp.]